ncbi:DUF2909 domain-containing protein [Azohydromonas aeria]|uniref:DUF2909 domain-containing protein n=1 Tax=Azohydromonas aeria TaxID=2590212 RepID=UPI0012F8A5E5|nr:DUF2909 domain-containing protein [Azohydromonas aeria]
MKTIIVLALLCILAALAGAGVLMLRRRPDDAAGAPGARPDKRMARALALRVGLSVALFVFILFSYLMGWIQPTGLPVVR